MSTVRRGFKWVSLTQGCVIQNSEGILRSFRTLFFLFFFNLFLPKHFHLEGGRVNANLEKFTFKIMLFLGTLPLVKLNDFQSG